MDEETEQASESVKNQGPATPPGRPVPRFKSVGYSGISETVIEPLMPENRGEDTERLLYVK